MQLNPSEISDLIKQRIESFEVGRRSAQRRHGRQPHRRHRAHSRPGRRMHGEMLEFPGDTFGLALNLERDSVGAVVLGDYEHISEGDTVKSTGRILEVPVGEAAGPRGRCAGQSDRRQGRHRCQADLADRKSRAGRDLPQVGGPAGADRPQVHRRHGARSAAASAS